MKPSDVQKFRLMRLEELRDIRFDGDIPALASALEKSDDHIRKMLKPESPGGRWMGEKLAREIEKRIDLPPGWMDGIIASGSRTAYKPMSTSQLKLQETINRYGSEIDDAAADSITQLILKLSQPR